MTPHKHPPLPPPAPRPSEQRRSQRFEMFASVKLTVVDDTLVLAARNISLGGIFLDVSPRSAIAHFRVGSHHDLLIFDALDERSPPVRVVGEVVRQEAAGVAFQWATDSPDTARKLSRLLASLQPRPSRG